MTGFPGVSVVKNLLAMQEMQETWVQSMGQEDPLEEGMATQSHGQRSLVDYSPWDHKELDMTEVTEHARMIT